MPDREASVSVLHLVSWYPTAANPHRTPFIPAHFHAASQRGRHELVHVEVLFCRGTPRFFWGQHPLGERFSLLTLPTHQARLVEIATLFLLMLVRLRLGRRWWDGVHVHIAWPLLRFPRLFFFLFGRQVLIGEHWTAFRFRFNLPKGSPGHQRMAAMFAHQLPVTTVTRTLASDIQAFAAPYTFPIHIIPNVVDPLVFYPAQPISAEPGKQGQKSTYHFLMVATWRPIKQPLLVLRACQQLVKQGFDLQLRIVGLGDQLPEMQALASTAPLAGHVQFLGALSKAEIANEMRQADALLHPSSYETFSVVCAEAISCGTPVLVSDLEAVAEFIDPSNGILVTNTVEDWRQAISAFCAHLERWQPEAIARAAHARFSPEVVGQQFRDLYQALWQPSC